MAAASWRQSVFGVIGALLVLEGIYFLYTGWATYDLYQWGAGEAASFMGFIQDGASANAVLDLLFAILGIGSGSACLLGHQTVHRIVSFSSPLILAWGVWVTWESAPAVASWAGALQGEQVALAALSGLVACAAGALGMAMLVSRSS